MPPPGRRTHKMRRASPPSRTRPLPEQSINLHYEVAVASHGEKTIDKYAIEDMQDQLKNGDTLESIGAYIKTGLLEDEFYNSKEEEVTILRLGTMEPYRCSEDNCRNQVAFNVNGSKMCKEHMVKEVQKGQNPDITPSEKGEFSPLNPEDSLKTILPEAPVEQVAAGPEPIEED